jgi:hypothetical protein
MRRQGLSGFFGIGDGSSAPRFWLETVHSGQWPLVADDRNGDLITACAALDDAGQSVVGANWLAVDGHDHMLPVGRSTHSMFAEKRGFALAMSDDFRAL